MYPLRLSPLDQRQLIWTPLEDNPLELYQLWGLVLYLVYISVLFLLAHEATIPTKLGYWGVYGISDAFWIPYLLVPITHQQGQVHSSNNHIHSWRIKRWSILTKLEVLDPHLYVQSQDSHKIPIEIEGWCFQFVGSQPVPLFWNAEESLPNIEPS